MKEALSLKLQTENLFFLLRIKINWENIVYWEESEQRELSTNKFDLSQIQLEGLGGVATLRKFGNFSPHLNLEIFT